MIKVLVYHTAFSKRCTITYPGPKGPVTLMAPMTRETPSIMADAFMEQWPFDFPTTKATLTQFIAFLIVMAARSNDSQFQLDAEKARAFLLHKGEP